MGRNVFFLLVRGCLTNYGSVQKRVGTYRDAQVVTRSTDVHLKLNPLFYCVAKQSLLTKLALNVGTMWACFLQPEALYNLYLPVEYWCIYILQYWCVCTVLYTCMHVWGLGPTCRRLRVYYSPYSHIATVQAAVSYGNYNCLYTCMWGHFLQHTVYISARCMSRGSMHSNTVHICLHIHVYSPFVIPYHTKDHIDVCTLDHNEW